MDGLIFHEVNHYFHVVADFRFFGPAHKCDQQIHNLYWNIETLLINFVLIILAGGSDEYSPGHRRRHTTIAHGMSKVGQQSA
jgi:hypothetical protein